MVGKVFMVSMYMNEDFYENYYKSFLKLIVDDPKYQVEIKYTRKKRGKKETVPEVESSALRSLIRQYVEHHKKKSQNKSNVEEDKNDN